MASRFNFQFAHEHSLLTFDKITTLRKSNCVYVQENLNENC